MATMYLSKWALTGGIKDVEPDPEDSRRFHDMIKVIGFATSFVIGKEIHKTREGAAKDAESQRARKLVSLRKQIKDMENKVF